MKFDPPAATLAYWKKRGAELVRREDIDRLEEQLNFKAPKSYCEFMLQYGSVEFDDEIDSQFSYKYSSEELTRAQKQPTSFIRKWVETFQHYFSYLSRARPKTKKQLISYIMKPARSIQYYEGFKDEPNFSLPEFLVPFGMDYGQGELLIEFGKETEKIYYWDFDAHDWETDQTQIAFVANDLYEFIESLSLYDEPE